MYTTGILDTPTRYSPHPFPNFYRGGVKKSVEIGLDLLHYSLSIALFDMKQHIGNKVSGLVQRWWSSVPSKFGTDWSSSLRSKVWIYAPLKKFAKSSITQPRIDQSCSHLVRIAWYWIYHTSSRSRDQRSRSQRDITGAKVREIINNSAVDCPISLKFIMDDDHETPNLPQSFKVNG